MTAQLTKIKAQRRAGGAQRRLRPGPGDRHASNYRQLGADAAAVPVARRGLEGVHQARPAPPPRACACPPRRCWCADLLPASDPQKPVVVGLQARLRGALQDRRLDLRRPRLRRPDAGGRTRSSAPARPTRPRCATRSKPPRATSAPAAWSTCRPATTWAWTSAPSACSRCKNGNWALVEVAPQRRNGPSCAWPAQWLQSFASGLTAGAIYALVALGFSIIYNASRAINFAQGEFVMIGGMSAVTLRRRRPAAAGWRCRWRCWPRSIVGAAAREARRRAGAPRRHRDADHHHHRRVDAAARAGAAGVGQARARAAGRSRASSRSSSAARRSCRKACGCSAARRWRWLALCVVLRPHAARQGDARHLAQPARRAAGGHQHARRAVRQSSAWRRRSARWAAC